MINETDVDMNNLVTDRFTLDNFKITKLTVKVFILGKMAKFMMESGKKALKKVLVFGKEKKVKVTLVSGKVVMCKVEVSIFGKMVTNMKGIGKTL